MVKTSQICFSDKSYWQGTGWSVPAPLQDIIEPVQALPAYLFLLLRFLCTYSILILKSNSKEALIKSAFPYMTERALSGMMTSPKIGIYYLIFQNQELLRY